MRKNKAKVVSPNSPQVLLFLQFHDAVIETFDIARHIIESIDPPPFDPASVLCETEDKEGNPVTVGWQALKLTMPQIQDLCDRSANVARGQFLRALAARAGHYRTDRAAILDCRPGWEKNVQEFSEVFTGVHNIESAAAYGRDSVLSALRLVASEIYDIHNVDPENEEPVYGDVDEDEENGDEQREHIAIRVKEGQLSLDRIDDELFHSDAPFCRRLSRFEVEYEYARVFRDRFGAITASNFCYLADQSFRSFAGWGDVNVAKSEFSMWRAAFAARAWKEYYKADKLLAYRETCIASGIQLPETTHSVPRP